MAEAWPDRASARQLRKRIEAEYRDMPGLQLTLRQACRLWDADPEIGRDVLEALVAAAFLRRDGVHYVRVDADSVGI